MFVPIRWVVAPCMGKRCAVVDDQFQGLATGSATTDMPITAVFGDDRLTGNAGCNTYNTTYSTGVDTITIEPMETTTMISAQPVVDQKRPTCRRSSRTLPMSSVRRRWTCTRPTNPSSSASKRLSERQPHTRVSDRRDFDRLRR